MLKSRGERDRERERESNRYLTWTPGQLDFSIVISRVLACRWLWEYRGLKAAIYKDAAPREYKVVIIATLLSSATGHNQTARRQTAVQLAPTYHQRPVISSVKYAVFNIKPTLITTFSPQMPNIYTQRKFRWGQ